MTNARIDRMVRELNSDPSCQFFQQLFGLVGLGASPAPANQAESHQGAYLAPALTSR